MCPVIFSNRLCGRPPQYAPAPCKLSFDLLTLKVVSESHVTWDTSVPILVFLGLFVLDLGPMYSIDVRRTDVRQTASSLNATAYRDGGIINEYCFVVVWYENLYSPLLVCYVSTSPIPSQLYNAAI